MLSTLQNLCENSGRIGGAEGDLEAPELEEFVEIDGWVNVWAMAHDMS
jgi:hypothetical protein